jgi:ribonuclease R
VILDEKGKPTEIKPVERKIGERIIEEFMLVANETVSEHLYWLNVPSLYRVHEEPDMDTIQDLNDFIHNLGYSIKGAGGDSVHPKAIQAVLDQIKGKPEERAVSTIILRSLKKARYTHEMLGHFALSVKYYTHFTSPIRRYPDLMIHRLLRLTAEKKMEGNTLQYYEKVVPEVGVSSSLRERTAEDAERDSVDLKKAEYMQDKIGETFEGTVSGITSYGFYVELPNQVEGLVRISSLEDDYYQFIEKSYLLQGERSKKQIKLGHPVKVKVVNVNLMMRTIDFEIVES